MSSKDAKPGRILLVGKPNSGKSLLFNRLTGLNQKVANFPGVTVELRRGYVGELECLDLPGLYSLDAISSDEAVAADQFRKAMRMGTKDTVICVLDATRLERSLILGLEVREVARQENLPIVFALNMWDELDNLGLEINTRGLSEAIDYDVIAISARTRFGINELSARVQALVSGDLTIQREIRELRGDIPTIAKDLANRFAPSSDRLLERQTAFDSVLLHSVAGILAFIFIMALTFQAVFTWASPAMGAVETASILIGGMLENFLPPGIIADFVKDGLLGGISAVLVFVPQIFLLTLFIGVLEDSGYLARAAMICHRFLGIFGMSGKSFVPLLTGHACAIPAILATRTIESPRARWLTWIAIPLMSCSARLPVYGLLIASVIPDRTYLGGLIGLQGATLLGLYLLGIFSGLAVTGMIHRFASHKNRTPLPFVLELPPYRLPLPKPLLIRAFGASKAFVFRAGSTIFVVSALIWALGYFPDGRDHLETSYLSAVGKFLAPLFAPLGVDWKVAVAVLTSFLAREVFVGTLGVLLGMNDLGENPGGASHLADAGIDLASGLALMVFFTISLQCVSTLAVLKRESGSKALPVVMFLSYGLIAYVLAVLAFIVMKQIY